MDRRIQYAGAIPQDTDILAAQQSAMVGLAKLSEAVFGATTTVRGMAVIQNPVQPALNVIVGAGDVYSVASLEASAYGSILADTARTIVKQGIMLDPVTLTITAPATAGFSQVYLVQVAFSEVDGTPVTMLYYNASNPSVPYSGPANAGTAQNTTRKGAVVVQLKAGTAATTGTQVAPAADSGYTGIATVTVANGATTVVTANIVPVAAAPLIPFTLPQLRPGFSSLQIFTAGGTFTVPAGVTKISIQVWGGGGGGGGSSSGNGGTGGGGAGYARGIYIVVPGTGYAVTVGAGGAAGTAGGGNGGNGGSSSFGSLISATAGSGGAGNANSGGAVGSGIGGQINMSGTSGGFAYFMDPGMSSGIGGSSFQGAGPGPNVNSAGTAGSFLGTGGNGASANATGGAGSGGIVILEW